jgi:hypothetical protein
MLRHSFSPKKLRIGFVFIYEADNQLLLPTIQRPRLLSSAGLTIRRQNKKKNRISRGKGTPQ